jgi:formate C-acetyltransferase
MTKEDRNPQRGSQNRRDFLRQSTLGAAAAGLGLNRAFPSDKEAMRPIHSTDELNAIRAAYLDVPDEAVFLERAKVLLESREKHAQLSAGLRQGMAIADLCDRITPVVNPCDILLGRILEEVPSKQDESFIKSNPTLFISPGDPGSLDSTSIYIPDWAKLLNHGIGGLIREVDALVEDNGHAVDEESRTHRDYLQGVRISLLAISRLMNRYADRAEQLAEETADSQVATRLSEAALTCRRVSSSPPTTFREALQLFSLFHTILSCVIGGRNVTPGRMDQYLLPFYRRDIASGVISRSEAIVLLAVTMIRLSQLTGKHAVDFESMKLSPCRYSHHYITLAGRTPDGSSGVNDLSFAFLKAIRLVDYREPSLCIRWFEDIDGEFWREALCLFRDRVPSFAYNDHVVVPSLVRCGVPERQALDYAHCACLICFLPGDGFGSARANHNLPRYVLRGINGGRDLRTNESRGPATPGPKSLRDFGDVVDAVRTQARAGLEKALQRHATQVKRYPLPVWPLFKGHLRTGYHYWEYKKKYADQHCIGLATSVDSLLAIRELVYRRKTVTLAELVSILKDNFQDHEPLRQYLLHQTPSYGNDDQEVLEMTQLVGDMWASEVERVDAKSDTIKLRPGFHSWLYNIDMGEQTAATPNGRFRGEPLSSDHLPSPGKGSSPTATLNAMARLPHRQSCSGGTTIRMSRSHFADENGLELLSSLICTYFDQGGLQLHFVFVDTATLLDAIEHPEKHTDLMVRITGFSEYFVRLSPEVQQEILRREMACESTDY